MTHSIALLSKPGGRKVNEDYCDQSQHGPRVCVALADGLGGHRAGEVASRAAVKAALERFSHQPGIKPEELADLAAEANGAVARLQQKEPALAGMKTTLVLWASDGTNASWGHVGDSRLYQFRKGNLVHQTKDHSLPQKLAVIGEISEEEIRFHEDRNRLTAVLQGEDPLRWTPVETPVELEPGDAFLLCTDGFWEYVDEPVMMEELSQADDAKEWLARLEKRLLAQVEDGHDNYSAAAIIVR